MQGTSVSKALVTPGEELGVEEEYLPGDNAYVDSGYVKSMVLGIAEWDRLNHVVNVKPLKLSLIRPGQIVYGKVYYFPNDKVAMVRIFAVQQQDGVRRIQAETGILYVTYASEERLGTIYDAVGLGDLVKARVLSSKPPYHISLRGPLLGVVETKCPQCRTVIVPSSTTSKITCPVCGFVFRRKAAPS
ncbi:MAG: exosome complex RNA-binding protein Csl4 [Caldivirga sp.]|uniref:exosome complex RNA-binding protein Csl4 n=1 Tax=Caldivirga sp. TaxID=2080243 RepID=UPI003D142F17